jgi:hypothetical protein
MASHRCAPIPFGASPFCIRSRHRAHGRPGHCARIIRIEQERRGARPYGLHGPRRKRARTGAPLAQRTPSMAGRARARRFASSKQPCTYETALTTSDRPRSPDGADSFQAAAEVICPTTAAPIDSPHRPSASRRDSRGGASARDASARDASARDASARDANARDANARDANARNDDANAGTSSHALHVISIRYRSRRTRCRHC